MKYLFKRLFCKHLNSIWLRPYEIPKDGKTIVYPPKVCQDCRKLFWATMSGPRVTYLKPIKIGGN